MDIEKVNKLVELADELGNLIDRDVEIITSDNDPDWLEVDILWEDFVRYFDSYAECHDALENMIIGAKLYRQCREEV